ncbi:MAG: signal transduction histidine kinase/ActR/RegA family two-component response regulator [Brevundimonas sp.]|jgi:signal transduction histidine kinase/ActR/RegA family two-component response regulator|uniref:ATP-binding protein n=1 Tax=Brevundimonas sp. TaxID=1871086 RepID=UPI0039E65A00
MSACATVAQVRFRELKSRIGLAAFIGVAAWIMAPSAWPLWWFLAVVATQYLDAAIFRPLRLTPDMAVSTAYRVLCCGVTMVSVIVYAGITAYLWFNGGEVGRIFAMVQCTGGLLHVSLHMHHDRGILFCAVTPHAAYFLGLPLIGALQSQSWIDLLVPVGGLLYMAHLVVAVRQSSMTNRVLREAKREADEQRRKAEIASAAKSDFLAVVSHEIRTPMNAVISAGNLLGRTRLSGPQKTHVSMLTDAGDVLMGLLNDVLDFSKIEAGKMQMEAAEMDVRERLASLKRLWEPRARASGVGLKITVAREVPDCLRTDPLRFQQILFNLMSNAVKFTAEGEIRVSAGWDEAGQQLSVAVRDSGCGIPADRLVEVFNSFEQADVGTTRRFGGTGLGLAISRRLAELMGGTLAVDSVEGEGTTFTLVLPVETMERSEPVAVPFVSEVGSLAGRSILAAEDHAVNRQILTLLLEPHGCRLTLVENGALAVEAAAIERFDAILMDMQMPVMDGIEASLRLRQEGVNRDTPVIALTANALGTHREAWEAAGVNVFLTKPIDPTALAAALLDACVDDRSARPEAAAVA